MKVSSKSHDGFQKCSFRPYQSYKGKGKDFNQNARERTKKERQ